MIAYFYITYQIPSGSSKLFEKKWAVSCSMIDAIKLFEKEHKGCKILRVLSTVKGDSRLKQFDEDNPY